MLASLIRRWDNAPLRVKGLVVIGIPLMPLVVTALLFLLGGRNAGAGNDWMGRANRAQTQIATVLRLVVDTDHSVSGLLLASDPDALRRFEAAEAALPSAIAQLSALVWDSAEQLDHVKRIDDLVARRPFAPLVALAKQRIGRPVPAALLADGRAATQLLRSQLADMQALQDRLIVGRSQRTRRFLVALAVGGAAFGLLFGGLGMMVFTSGVVQRIDRLCTDAGHLARSEPLGAPHDASDELGDLTRSIHDAARLLRSRDEEAREHARTLAGVNRQLELRAAELSAVNEELEAFSYSVSHDLRAPLRHITGFASLLQRSAGGRLVDQETRYLQTMVDAAKRMGRLIDDLLAFSRMGRSPLDRRQVVLNELVVDARRDLVRPDGAPEIAWTVHPLPDVDGDRALLRQVFVNLLANAAKYSSSRPHPAIEVGTVSNGTNETVVYVRDNGVGFDMAYVDKLFGVFQRLHSSDAFEGTGIGLANVRRIIHRHGGRVWADAVVDAGATFYFSLPHAGVGC